MGRDFGSEISRHRRNRRDDVAIHARFRTLAIFLADVGRVWRTGSVALDEDSVGYAERGRVDPDVAFVAVKRSARDDLFVDRVDRAAGWIVATNACGAFAVQDHASGHALLDQNQRTSASTARGAVLADDAAPNNSTANKCWRAFHNVACEHLADRRRRLCCEGTSCKWCGSAGGTRRSGWRRTAANCCTHQQRQRSRAHAFAR